MKMNVAKCFMLSWTFCLFSGCGLLYVKSRSTYSGKNSEFTEYHSNIKIKNYLFFNRKLIIHKRKEYFSEDSLTLLSEGKTRSFHIKGTHDSPYFLDSQKYYYKNGQLRAKEKSKMRSFTFYGPYANCKELKGKRIDYSKALVYNNVALCQHIKQF